MSLDNTSTNGKERNIVKKELLYHDLRNRRVDIVRIRLFIWLKSEFWFKTYANLNMSRTMMHTIWGAPTNMKSVNNRGWQNTSLPLLAGLQVLIALGHLATHDRAQDPVINNQPTIVGTRGVPQYPYYPTIPYITPFLELAERSLKSTYVKPDRGDNIYFDWIITVFPAFDSKTFGTKPFEMLNKAMWAKFC